MTMKTLDDNSNSYDEKSFMVMKKPFYLEQNNEISLFEAAYRSKLPLMLKGPTGCGKTRLVEYMAWKLKRPLFTIPCHEDLSGNDLIGRYILKGGNVEWVDGPLLMSVKHSGIVYLDEIVEARKDTTVVIHPLTDHRRYLPVEKLKTVYNATDGFMLVISYNPNYQSILKELKPSTRQRFVGIHLGWPEETLELEVLRRESGLHKATAQKLVSIANRIRNLTKDSGLEEGVSTRELVYCGKLLKSKVDTRDAIISTLIEPLTHDDDMKKSIELIINNYFSI